MEARIRRLILLIGIGCFLTLMFLYSLHKTTPVPINNLQKQVVENTVSSSGVVTKQKLKNSHNKKIEVNKSLKKTTNALKHPKKGFVEAEKVVQQGDTIIWSGDNEVFL